MGNSFFMASILCRSLYSQQPVLQMFQSKQMQGRQMYKALHMYGKVVMTQMLNGKNWEPEAEGIIMEAYASVNPAPEDNEALRRWEEELNRWLESEAADSLYESIVNYRDSSWGVEEMTPADGRVFPGYEALPFGGMPGTGDFNSVYSQGGACSKRMPSSEPQAGLFCP